MMIIRNGPRHYAARQLGQPPCCARGRRLRRRGCRTEIHHRGGRAASTRCPAEDGAIQVVAARRLAVDLYASTASRRVRRRRRVSSQRGRAAATCAARSASSANGERSSPAHRAGPLGEAFDELHVAERVAVAPSDAADRADLPHPDGVDRAAGLHRRDPPRRARSASLARADPRRSSGSSPACRSRSPIRRATWPSSWPPTSCGSEKTSPSTWRSTTASSASKSLRFVTEDDTRTTLEGLSVLGTGVLPSMRRHLRVRCAGARRGAGRSARLHRRVRRSISAPACAWPRAAEVHTTSAIGYHSFAARRDLGRWLPGHRRVRARGRQRLRELAPA